MESGAPSLSTSHSVLPHITNHSGDHFILPPPSALYSSALLDPYSRKPDSDPRVHSAIDHGFRRLVPFGLLVGGFSARPSPVPPSLLGSIPYEQVIPPSDEENTRKRRREAEKNVDVVPPSPPKSREFSFDISSYPKKRLSCAFCGCRAALKACTKRMCVDCCPKEGPLTKGKPWVSRARNCRRVDDTIQHGQVLNWRRIPTTPTSN
jgi:hypothetical protein